MKEKKGRLYKFYGKLTIRNKLLISCLPFVILGYFLILRRACDQNKRNGAALDKRRGTLLKSKGTDNALC